MLSYNNICSTMEQNATIFPLGNLTEARRADVMHFKIASKLYRMEQNAINWNSLSTGEPPSS